MSKRIVTIIAVFIFFVGIGLITFPIISIIFGNYITTAETEKFELKTNSVIDSDITYKQALEEKMIDFEGYLIDNSGKRTSNNPVIFRRDLKKLKEDSFKYNENLKLEQNTLLIDEHSYIQATLNLSDYGIIDEIYGYVSAPTIGMKLPIYLGASDANMSYGAAHMTYTSLPLGGESTNTVLAGHTGYVGRVFFDNLRNLQIGDEVILRNFWDKLKYRVIETKVCKPNESNDVFIKNKEDILTMITCIKGNDNNYDRYYVICKRI